MNPVCLVVNSALCFQPGKTLFSSMQALKPDACLRARAASSCLRPPERLPVRGAETISHSENGLGVLSINPKPFPKSQNATLNPTPCAACQAEFYQDVQALELRMYLRAAAASACRVRATLLVPLFDAAGRGAGVLQWADGSDALVPDRPFAVLEMAVAQANPYGILGLYMWMRDRLSVRALACSEIPLHASKHVHAWEWLGAEHPVCTVLAWCVFLLRLGSPSWQALACQP